MRFVRRVSPASRLVIGAVLVAVMVTATARNTRTPESATAASPFTASLSAAAPSLTTAPASAAQPSAAGANPRPSAPEGPGSGGSVTASASAAPTNLPAGGALSALLATLRVAPEARDGYKRTLFKLWIDEDDDGCDTRREVLIVEAVTTPTVGSSCSLAGGEWLSPYDGVTFTDPSGLDIDHVVPLAEAWDSGASAWTADRRMRFANDLDVPWALVAVSAGSNRSKGDRDPADWMPPLESFTCTYVAWWVEGKARWSLTIDTDEQDALARFVAMCRSTPVSLVLAP